MVPLATTALASPAAPSQVKARDNYMYLHEQQFSEMSEFTSAFQQVVLTDTSQLANRCWEIKHTQAHCPHEEEHMDVVCKPFQALLGLMVKTWKTGIVFPLERMAKHPFSSTPAAFSLEFAFRLYL